MTTIDFNCPNCGASIHAPANAGGKTGTCMKCNQKLKVPHRMVSPAEAFKPVVAMPLPQPTVKPTPRHDNAQRPPPIVMLSESVNMAEATWVLDQVQQR